MTDPGQLSLFADSASSSPCDAPKSPSSSAPTTSSIEPSPAAMTDATGSTPSRPAKARSQLDSVVHAGSSFEGAISTAASGQLPLPSISITRTAPDPYLSIPRPRTRGDCEQEARPCPWVGCRHHLLLEVALAGGSRQRATSLTLNGETSRGGRRKGLRSSSAAALVQVWIDDAIELLASMAYTCELDVIRDYPDGLPARGVGQLLGITRQAVERDETKPRVVQALRQLREFVDEE